MEENMAPASGFRDDPILPDGWKEGDDIFSLSPDKPLSLADEPDTDAAADAEKQEPEPEKEAEPEPDAPTPGGQEEGPAADGDGQQAGDENPEAAPDEERKPAPTPPRVIKIRVDREDRDFNVTDTSDEELRTLIQKGLAFDRREEAERRKLYREVHKKVIDDGFLPEVAAAVAAHAAGGKDYPLTDDADETRQENRPAPQPQPDFRAQMDAMREEFHQQFDALKASTAEQDATIAALRKENATLKQQAKAAQRAPVKGVSGGGGQKKASLADLFVEGMNSFK